MALVRFTENLQRHIHCPDCRVTAATLGEALNNVFEQHPRLRSYILDDQGRLRKHIAIFVDGRMLKDKTKHDIPVAKNATIDVIQALSGG